MNMKVAICSVQEFNPMIGGIERVSVSLAQELVKCGVDVIFIACRRSKYSDDYQLPCEQYLLPDSADYAEENVSAFTNLVREHKIDVIINQNAHSHLYNRLIEDVKAATGVKVVSVLHFDPASRLSGNQKLRFSHTQTLKQNVRILALYLLTRKYIRNLTMRGDKRLYRHLYEVSDKVVLLSKTFIPAFKEIGGLKEAAKLTAIHNMLSFQFSENERYAKEKTVLFCGRLTPQKRPDQFLKVWQKVQDRLPDWRAVMVGDGNERRAVEAYAKKLKLERIDIVGFQQPIAYYKSAAIFAMTSAHEGWSLTISESMQYGCVPVAYQSFASITDQIRDGETGYLVPTYDNDAFAERIIYLANHPSRLQQMSAAAIESRKAFRRDVIARQWKALLQEVENDKPQTR
jgi:glycosyltransferase involved in cell wall biosynthesis